MAREALIVYLDPEVKEALARMARLERSSPSAVARRLLSQEEGVAALASKICEEREDANA